MGAFFPKNWPMSSRLSVKSQGSVTREPALLTQMSSQTGTPVLFNLGRRRVAWRSSHAAGSGVPHGSVVGGRGSGITYAEKSVGFQLELTTLRLRVRLRLGTFLFSIVAGGLDCRCGFGRLFRIVLRLTVKGAGLSSPSQVRFSMSDVSPFRRSPSLNPCGRACRRGRGRADRRQKSTELKVDITDQSQQPRVGHLKAERAAQPTHGWCTHWSIRGTTSSRACDYFLCASSPRRQLEGSSLGFLAETRSPSLLPVGLRKCVVLSVFLFCPTLIRQ